MLCEISEEIRSAWEGGRMASAGGKKRGGCHGKEGEGRGRFWEIPRAQERVRGIRSTARLPRDLPASCNLGATEERMAYFGHMRFLSVGPPCHVALFFPIAPTCAFEAERHIIPL